MTTFEELSRNYHGFLDGRITVVSADGTTMRMLFECDCWRETRRRQFEFIFQDVAECTVVPAAIDAIDLGASHPLLWDHNLAHCSLFFYSAPADPESIIGRLYEAHARLFGGWRDMGRYVKATTATLRAGFGLLAEGPGNLIAEYARVVEGVMRCSRLTRRTPAGGYAIALFDDCYAVCRSVAAIEHTAVAGGSASTSVGAVAS